jgi:nucleoside-diphosphate-sugar epimerase
MFGNYMIVVVTLLCCMSGQSLKILVLGGTGFVGQRFIQHALATDKSIDIVALSRRGIPSENFAPKDKVTWVSTDVGDSDALMGIHDKYGPFDACLHCIGLLFDTNSGLADLNTYASGSGSIPDSSSTYDRVTRQTAMNAIEAFTKYDGMGKPFVFISAAEAGWTFTAPVGFLERYLVAKRSVESNLLASILRPIIFRPSLIWTTERPQGLISVIPFFVASKLGVPFVGKPVRVEDLVSAILTSILDNSTRGILNYERIEALSNIPNRNSCLP